MAEADVNFRLVKLIPEELLEDKGVKPKVELLTNLLKTQQDVRNVLASRITNEQKVNELLKLVGDHSETKLGAPDESSESKSVEDEKPSPFAPSAPAAPTDEAREFPLAPSPPPEKEDEQPSAKRWKHQERCRRLLKAELL